MTVNEFIDYAKDYGDFDITIRKHDNGQLSSNTTVGVESVNVGFDWTFRQMVLQPKVNLTTVHSDQDWENFSKRLVDMMVNETNFHKHMKKLEKLVESEVTDEKVKVKLLTIIKENEHDSR